MSLEEGWRYVGRSGGVQGPIAWDELRRLLEGGILHNESQVHHRMMGWRWLGHVLHGSSYSHPHGRSHRPTGNPATGPLQGGSLSCGVTTVSAGIASEQGTGPLASRVTPTGNEPGVNQEAVLQSEKKLQAVSLARQPSLLHQESGSPRTSASASPSNKFGESVMRQTVPAVRSSLQPAPVAATGTSSPKGAGCRPPAAQVVPPAQAGQCVAGTTHAYGSGNAASQSWTAGGSLCAGGTGRMFLDASEGPPPDQSFLIVGDDDPEPKAGPRPFAIQDKATVFEDVGREDILLGVDAGMKPSAKRQRRVAWAEEANAPSGPPQPQPRKPQFSHAAKQPQKPLETHEHLQVKKPKKPPVQQLQTEHSASLDERSSKDRQSLSQLKPQSKAAPASAGHPAIAATTRAAPAKSTPHAAASACRGLTDRDDPDDLRQAKRRKLMEGLEGKAAVGSAGKGAENGCSLPQWAPQLRALHDKRGSELDATGSGAAQSVAAGSVTTGVTGKGTARAARDIAGAEGSAQGDGGKVTVNSTTVSRPGSAPPVARPPRQPAPAAQAVANGGKVPGSTAGMQGSVALGPGQSRVDRSQSAVGNASGVDQAAGGARTGTAAAAPGPSAAGLSARQARQGLSLPNIADLVKLNGRHPASLLSLVTGTAPEAPRPVVGSKLSLMDTVINLPEKRRQNLPPEVFLALDEVWQFRVGSVVYNDVCALELQDKVARGELEPSTMATHVFEGTGCTVKTILEDNARAVTIVTCIRDKKPCPAAPLVVDVSLYDQHPEVKPMPSRPWDLPPKSASAPSSPLRDDAMVVISVGNGSEHGGSKRSRPPPSVPPPQPPRRRVSTMSADLGPGALPGALPVANGAAMRTPVPPPYRQPNTGYAPLSQVRRRPYRETELGKHELTDMPSNGHAYDGGPRIYGAAASMRDGGGAWGGLHGPGASDGMAWGGGDAGGAVWGEDDVGGDYGGGGRSTSPDDVPEPAPRGFGAHDVAGRAAAQAGGAGATVPAPAQAPAVVINSPLEQCAVPSQSGGAQQQPVVPLHSRLPPRQPPPQPAQPAGAQPQPLPGSSQQQPRAGWPEPGGRGPAPSAPPPPRAQGVTPPVGVPLPMHGGLPPGLGSEEPPKLPTVAVADPAPAAAENPAVASNPPALPLHLRKPSTQGQQQRPEQHQAQRLQSRQTQPQTQPTPSEPQHQGHQQSQQAPSQPQNPPHEPHIQPQPSTHPQQTQTPQQVANPVTAPVQQIPTRPPGEQAAAAAGIATMSVGADHGIAETHPAQAAPPLRKEPSRQDLAPTTALPPRLWAGTNISVPVTHVPPAPGPSVGAERPLEPAADTTAATRTPALAAASTASGPAAGQGAPPPAQVPMAATSEPGADVASVAAAGGTTAEPPVKLAVTKVNPHTVNLTLNLNHKDVVERLEMVLKMLRSQGGQADTAPTANPLLAMSCNAGAGSALPAQTVQAQSLADTATNAALAQAATNPLLPQPPQPSRPCGLNLPQEQQVGTAVLEVAVAGTTAQAAPNGGLQAGVGQSAIDMSCTAIKPEPGLCEGRVGPQLPESGQAAQNIKSERVDGGGGAAVTGVVGRAPALAATVLKFKIYPLHLFFCEPYIPEPMTEDWGLHPIRPEFVEVEDDDDADAVLTLEEDQDVTDAYVAAGQGDGDTRVWDKLGANSGETTAVNEAAVDLLYNLLRGV